MPPFAEWYWPLKSSWGEWADPRWFPIRPIRFSGGREPGDWGPLYFQGRLRIRGWDSMGQDFNYPGPPWGLSIRETRGVLGH